MLRAVSKRRWPWFVGGVLGAGAVVAALVVLRPWTKIGQVTDAECSHLAVSGHTLVAACHDLAREQPEYPTELAVLQRFDPGAAPARITETADVIALEADGPWVLWAVRSFAHPGWRSFRIAPLAGGAATTVVEGDTVQLVAFGGGRVLLRDRGELRTATAPDWKLGPTTLDPDLACAAFDARGGVVVGSHAAYAVDANLVPGAKLAELPVMLTSVAIVGDELVGLDATTHPRRLFRIPRAGGAPRIVTLPAGDYEGASIGANGVTWRDGDERHRLHRVSLDGGAPQTLAESVGAYAFDGSTLYWVDLDRLDVRRRTIAAP